MDKKMYIENKEIKKMYFGNVIVKKLYKGNDLIFEVTPTQS